MGERETQGQCLMNFDVIVPAFCSIVDCVCVKKKMNVPEHSLKISTPFYFLHFALRISLHLGLPTFPSFLVFQVILLLQAFPLRLWQPTPSLTSSLLLT